LSERRAASVKDYLVHKGLNDRRIETKGFGSSRPVADNSTEAGRSRNRRVEIVLGQ
jgi:outer membrane protein OmpA-like peptidoglycan-associated protein